MQLGLGLATRSALVDRARNSGRLKHSNAAWNSEYNGKEQRTTKECLQSIRLRLVLGLGIPPLRVRPKRPLAFRHKSLFVTGLGDSQDNSS